MNTDSYRTSDRLLLAGLAAAGLPAGILQLFGTANPALALAGAFLIPPALLALALAWHLRPRPRDDSISSVTPGGSRPLFDSADDEAGMAKRPIPLLLTVVLPALLAFAAAIGAGRVLVLTAPDFSMPENIYFMAAIAGVEFLVLLALGRYFSLRGADPACVLLRPLAGLCLMAGRMAALAFIALLALRFEWNWVLSLAGWSGGTVLALLSLEYAFRLLGRRPGGESADWARHIQSGVSALVAEPASCGRICADMLDYQFGYAFSRTWVYDFAARSILPFCFTTVVLTYLLSSFVVIGPEESGVLERLGVNRTPDSHLTSGWHWKLPWPLETVRRFPTRRIHTLNVGYVPAPERSGKRTAYWTAPHHSREAYFLVPSDDDTPLEEREDATAPARAAPANILVMNIPVEYTVTNIAQYIYGFTDSAAALEQAAMRVITRRAAGTDMLALLTTARGDIANAWRDDIQVAADKLELGVQILFVGAHDIRPPPQVAEAFQSVAASREEQHTLAMAGQTWAVRELPLARGRAASQMAEAESYKLRRAGLAEADAARFQSRSAAYAVSPRVFRARETLRAITTGLAAARKYVLAGTVEREVLILDMESKTRPELWDLSVPSE